MNLRTQFETYSVGISHLNLRWSRFPVIHIIVIIIVCESYVVWGHFRGGSFAMGWTVIVLCSVFGSFLFHASLRWTQLVCMAGLRGWVVFSGNDTPIPPWHRINRPQGARLGQESVLWNDILRGTGQCPITSPALGMHTVSVFCITLGKECVRSTQGLIKTHPAGIGSPISRRIERTDRHRPPPAESPIKCIC